MPELSVTAVVINFRTAELTRKAVESFFACYPSVPMLLIDNGSKDGSTLFLKQFHQMHSATTDLLINSNNIHHGPAMDLAMRSLMSDTVLFIDSDCIVRKGGFLEEMEAVLASDPENYIVGRKINMNKRGFPIEKRGMGIPYILPFLMLVRRAFYLELPKFSRHGSPCLKNYESAARRGLKLADFPVEGYVEHLGRGTAGLHGYSLGLRGKLNYILNKFGI